MAVVVVSAADAATKPDRLETGHVVRAEARREGALRPFFFLGIAVDISASEGKLENLTDDHAPVAVPALPTSLPRALQLLVTLPPFTLSVPVPP